ncbi:MAG: hypothetical protein ACPGQR_03855 [Marinirhabdus sp.]
MKKKFYIAALLFFFPVVTVFLLVEHFTLQVPESYINRSVYLLEEKDNLEVLLLGSSQINDGINPALLSHPTINLASGNQHHDTDLKKLKQVRPRLPKLKTVLIEVSYSHFELPHNGKNWWKNSAFLKFYNFERNTYFKDKFLYISNLDYYSERLIDYHIRGNNERHYNRFGFNVTNFPGQFEDHGYDLEVLDGCVFKINKIPNLRLFENNIKVFFEIMDYLREENLNVIICKAPMFNYYLRDRVPEILARRDSIVRYTLKNYPNTTLLDLETDTLSFTIRDYKNPSHLNPRGATVFSKRLQETLDDISN